MLRLRTNVTTSPTAARRRSSATSATRASSRPRAPSRVTISSTPTSSPASTPSSTSPTGPPARRRDRPEELVGRARRGAVHRGARLGQEVLDDHLLHVTLALVARRDREQRLDAFLARLADADEDAGRERDAGATRGLERRET